MQSSIIKGEANCLFKMWHENGKLMKVVNYKDDLMNGTMSLYYEDGQLEYEVMMIEGLENGDAKTFFKGG